MSTGKDHAQEKYTDKMKRLGHVKVGAWVPEHLRDHLLDYAYDLRVKHEDKTT
jgi:hypothetical protein